ncbi:transcription factor bHLH146-like [Magnolia sinica]|uniref:transcription factor bHLH146-like n=1 Tax=Magnolia sinica TaxID=86752 RepID=UPI0026584A30|nr:transcription factor bHLH146-like [Magnolia sinica]
MEEVQRHKRKRVYSFDPNTTLRASFLQNYLNYLLPALLKIQSNISSNRNEDEEQEKMIRFEVDMALISSAAGFSWSHALKHKLQTDMNVKSLCNTPTHEPTSLTLHPTCERNRNCTVSKMIRDHSPSPPFLSPSFSFASHRNPNPNPDPKTSRNKPRRSYRPRKQEPSKINIGEEEGLGGRLTTLRRILPGGDEMGMHELLSEVQSYIICLQLQVSVLQSLVNAD